MVLGLRSKNKRPASVQADYLVSVQEINPWPPSQSLRSIESVVLECANGDQNCGSYSSFVGVGCIEFHETFALSVTLCRDKRARDNFQKNCLEFNLYESRSNKTAKGQLLGSGIINLGDYGIIKKNFDIGVLLNCKKNSRNAAQPFLYVSLQPFDKDSSNPSPNSSLSKEASLDKDGGGFVSGLTSEDLGDESEIASFTDDDISPRSSPSASSSTVVNKSSLPKNREVADGEGISQERAQQAVPDKVVDKLAAEVASKDVKAQESAKFDLASSRYPQTTEVGSEQVKRPIKDSLPEAKPTKEVQTNLMVSEDKKEQQENREEKMMLEEKRYARENGKVSQDTTTKRNALRSETLTFGRKVHEDQGSSMANNKLKTLKSVQLPLTPSKDNGFSGKSRNVETTKDVDSVKVAGSDTSSNAAKADGNKPSNVEWKSRVEMLEEELRQAAIVEAALYSVVAEHGSSTNKVHAPARRLSRFYLHACKEKSHAKRARAAKASVSGLILVSKSCGNDVPRLTFWLSNSIMLRAIVSQAVNKAPLSYSQTNGTRKGLNGRSSPKRGIPLSSETKKNNVLQESGDWENPQTFGIALEKLEAWIFSRIVESVWWQTLTPHMQSAAAKNSARTSSSRRGKVVLGDQEQGSFSIELWKKAFKDACERLCPIRAGGHECGCLPVLARLVMEQLVDRLDVAMFNAILRESAEEMPTDPVSDPISDPKVLPVLPGKSSFGAGAQLKNAVGNWARWLSDLFGIEDSDSADDDINPDATNGTASQKSFKAFRFLNALSDLMMLPSDMVADSSTRKEVCPTLSASLIKRVVYSYVPDEFSPDPIPPTVLDALDAEDDAEEATEDLIAYPCTATPTLYSPPPAASLAGFVGVVGSQALQRSSSVLKKAYTSDDELDELDSPMNSIILDNSRVSPSTKSSWMPKGGGKVIRYQLLREVWRESE